MDVGSNPLLVALAKATIGPILLGTFLNVLLFGVSLTQFYLYFESCQKDRSWIGHMLLVLLALDTLNTVGLIGAVYDALITNYGSQASVMNAGWVFPAANCIVTSVIAFIVQVFYAWRIHVLTHQRITPLLLVFLSVIANLGGTGVGISIIGWIPDYLEFYRFKIPCIIWLVCTFLCDLGITSSLVWYLKEHKTGNSETDSVLDRIMWFTVQTGMVTCIMAVVDLILYLAYTEGYHITINLLLAKLYMNTLLSSLNARRRWQFGGHSNGGQSVTCTPSNAPATALEFRHDQTFENEVAGNTEVIVMHAQPQDTSITKFRVSTSDARTHSSIGDIERGNQ